MYKTMAKISIGMPAHNAEAHIERAIESLRNQTFRDFELLISDNASTDLTGAIGKKYAEIDSRIRYIKQSTNIGAFNNFKFVLDAADSGYFMWAAADDFWLPRFLEENANFLDSHAEYVASVSKAAFDGGSIADDQRMGTESLDGTIVENLEKYVLNPAANTRFYGLHHTNILRSAWPIQPYWAADWAVVCKVLTHGKYHELSEVLMVRDPQGASSRAYQSIRELNAGALHTVFPYLAYSCNVLKFKEARCAKIIFHLVWLNVDGAVMMARKWLSRK